MVGKKFKAHKQTPLIKETVMLVVTTSYSKASANAIEPFFLDPLDELGVGIDLDVYINEQMMQNKQMKKFLKDQEKRTNEIIQSQPSMPSTGTIGHTHSSSSEKGGSSMSSKGSPNPKAMSRSLIHLLAILKQHQANARDALVHITAREKNFEDKLEDRQYYLSKINGREPR